MRVGEVQRRLTRVVLIVVWFAICEVNETHALHLSIGPTRVAASGGNTPSCVRLFA